MSLQPAYQLTSSPVYHNGCIDELMTHGGGSDQGTESILLLKFTNGRGLRPGVEARVWYGYGETLIVKTITLSLGKLWS